MRAAVQAIAGQGLDGLERSQRRLIGHLDAVDIQQEGVGAAVDLAPLRFRAVLMSGPLKRQQRQDKQPAELERSKRGEAGREVSRPGSG